MTITTETNKDARIPSDIEDNLTRMQEIKDRWATIFSFRIKVNSFYEAASKIENVSETLPEFPITEEQEAVLPGDPKINKSLRGICNRCRRGEKKYSEISPDQAEEKARFRKILNRYLFTFKRALDAYYQEKHPKLRWVVNEQIPFLESQLSFKKEVLTHRPFAVALS